MRNLNLLVALLLVLAVVPSESAKKPHRTPSSRRPPPRRGAPPSRQAPRRRQQEDYDDEEDAYDEMEDYEEEDEEEDYDDYEEPPPRRKPSGRRGPPPSSRGGRYRDEPPPRRGGPRSSKGRGGRVVPYGRRQPQESGFTKGLNAIRSSMPDPSTVKDAALSSLSAARQTTASLSSNLYREVKGLTSSELEQVMLKATRPDDTPVKGKHAERLVGVTYQISARYDIYDAVLRKLWSKMAEKDWRTTIKAVYVLHRFSADGAPEHAPALKARLRELRRTKDPKRKDKYFNSKQLLAGDATPENAKFRAFLARYAHYVLLRAQCFSGIFDEIGTLPKDKKKGPPKPITSTCLRLEHLDAAKMLLKAGLACQLKEGEECENTALAVERVASDLIGLSAAVAMALNRSLKDPDLKGAQPDLLRQWCEWYSQDLVKETKAMVKKTSAKLDAFGLFLPSRMGTTVSQDLLDKGLALEDAPSSKEDSEGSLAKAAEETAEEEVVEEEEQVAEEEEAEEEEANEDEYEYDEEYYDDEDL